MAFSIKFTDEPDEYLDDDRVTASAVGEFVIGDWRENFVSTLYEWNKQDYESQWLKALQQLLDSDPKSVLITEYLSPSVSSKLEWWPLYIDGNIVHIQNHILWYEQLDGEFDVSRACDFVKERQTMTEDGNRISEWEISLREIEIFIVQTAANW